MELDHRLLCNCLELASGWMFACERESCDFSMYSDDRVSEAKVDLAPVAARIRLSPWRSLHEEGGGEQILEQPGPDLPNQQMFPTSPAAFSLSLSLSLGLGFFFLFEAL